MRNVSRIKLHVYKYTITKSFKVIVIIFKNMIPYKLKKNPIIG